MKPYTLLFALLLSGAAAAQHTPDHWPKTAQAGDATYTLYQPQVTKWDGYTLQAHAAVSVLPKGARQPFFGAVNLQAETKVDKTAQLVTLDDFHVTKTTFPSAPAQSTSYGQTVEKLLNSGTSAMPLPQLQADLAIVQAEQNAPKVATQNPVPTFFWSPGPAVLVTIHGEPVWGKVPNSSLQRVLNTNALIVQGNDGRYYLHLYGGWVTASSWAGPWSAAHSVPAEFTAATQVRGVDLLSPKGSTLGPTPPTVFVSTTSAELIVTQGTPRWTPLGSTGLLYMSNTSGNVFRDTRTQTIYVLVSGRWFSASSLGGPWQYVAGAALPAAFAAIPDDSPKENVKASIPGTWQAREAAIAHQIPHTVSVNPAKATFTPAIDGAPHWQPVEGTPLQAVANSNAVILKVNESSYYACYQGVWFHAPALAGPWTVATSVPPIVYTIPVSSPYHYVTYVKVYDAENGEVIVGYTPGYMGAALSSEGVVVYGTGYNYAPYVGSYGYYPVPVTYGYAANMAWTPGTDWAYAYGLGWGAVGYAPAPAWGAWNTPAYAVWGPGGGVATTGDVYKHWGTTGAVTTTTAGYNAWTGNAYETKVGRSYNSTNGRISVGQSGTVENVYTGNSASGQRGATYNPTTGRSTQGGEASIYNNSTGQQSNVGRISTSSQRTGGNTDAVHVNNNVYADHNGNVYRNTGSGWQTYSEDGWTTVNGPSRTGSMETRAQSRQTGAWRSQSFGQTGGYRNTGGGFGSFRGRR